jgi:hypothetical protein
MVLPISTADEGERSVSLQRNAILRRASRGRFAPSTAKACSA